jgi:hypothetical protein
VGIARRGAAWMRRVVCGTGMCRQTTPAGAEKRREARRAKSSGVFSFRLFSLDKQRKGTRSLPPRKETITKPTRLRNRVQAILQFHSSLSFPNRCASLCSAHPTCLTAKDCGARRNRRDRGARFDFRCFFCRVGIAHIALHETTAWGDRGVFSSR